MGRANLPKTKWFDAGRQVILKQDFIDIEAAIIEVGGGGSVAPALTWIDVTSVKVMALTDSPAPLMLSGFPNLLHPGSFISGDSDGRFRENTSDVTMDFDVAASLWGTEKASQWSAIYAIAGDADTEFTLKSMPWMRVKSQTDQTISLGTNGTPATGIGYGFTTDELIDAYIYFISGASKGLLRAITANNNDNTTGGTLTYGDTSLSVAQGDWFIVLPATNFRWIGDIFNNSSSNIVSFSQTGNIIFWPYVTANTGITIASPMARRVSASIKIVASMSLTVADNTYFLRVSDGSNEGTIAYVTVDSGVISAFSDWIRADLPLSDICTLTFSGTTQQTYLTITPTLYCDSFEYPRGFLG